MENKIVSIYSEKLKFLYVEEIELLQEKFDLLFTTAKLMGYKINFKDTLFTIDACYYSHSVKMYAREKAGISKAIEICFDVLKKNEKVESVSIFTNHRVPAYCKDSEKMLLDELDKLLVYI